MYCPYSGPPEERHWRILALHEQERVKLLKKARTHTGCRDAEDEEHGDHDDDEENIR
jgi:hypothetical protein